MYTGISTVTTLYNNYYKSTQIKCLEAKLYLV